MKEQAKGNDKLGVGVKAGLMDLMNAKKVWRIQKYADDKAFKEGTPFEEVEFEGNMLLNEGITVLQNLIAGLGTPTAWNNANARLGVGESDTAESAAQTGLVGATTFFQPMESGYPSIAGQATTWRAVFDGDDANFDWNEFTVVNAATNAGDNLNRKVSAQGTKASGQTWTLDLTITWS